MLSLFPLPFSFFCYTFPQNWGFLLWTLELVVMPSQLLYLCLCHLSCLCSVAVPWLRLMVVQHPQQPELWLYRQELVSEALDAGGWPWWCERAAARVRQRFPSVVCGSKPPSAVCGWVKAWIFHTEKQYSVFILANNSLHPDIIRPMGSAKEISFKHPPPNFASHSNYYSFSSLSFFSVSEVLLFTTMSDSVLLLYYYSRILYCKLQWCRNENQSGPVVECEHGLAVSQQILMLLGMSHNTDQGRMWRGGEEWLHWTAGAIVTDCVGPHQSYLCASVTGMAETRLSLDLDLQATKAGMPPETLPELHLLLTPQKQA